MTGYVYAPLCLKKLKVTHLQILSVPNKKAKTIIVRSIGCNRFVYNYFLTKRKNLYANHIASTELLFLA
ncbi:helix-turn-helix domain-containing protein [Succinispira mobilis]|uniref:helix-turn-helix domain-containing protein n=1 Tax=Succinispira mobilis TaxID=78120 RepID=UPI0008FBDE14|nr:helix-turn-helix domain-containing protein [Succinispira mobilis]